MGCFGALGSCLTTWEEINNWEIWNYKNLQDNESYINVTLFAYPAIQTTVQVKFYFLQIARNRTEGLLVWPWLVVNEQVPTSRLLGPWWSQSEEIKQSCSSSDLTSITRNWSFSSDCSQPNRGNTTDQKKKKTEGILVWSWLVFN